MNRRPIRSEICKIRACGCARGPERFLMDFSVIDGPPDETVQWKYVEEARPRRDREKAQKDPGPLPLNPAPTSYTR